MKREVAWRIFAGEYNDSNLELKGEGDMAPSYVVTPLGAKVNRLFVIGVLTDVENVSEDGDLIRAHISDPTGVFTLYSGQYQPEVKEALTNIDAPAFVAVIGKSRTYTPEEGTLYLSIRPERVMEVDSEIRDRWILETCKNTKQRIQAIFEAMKMNEPSTYELKKLGNSRDLSEGIVEAIKNYKDIDLNKYIEIIQESLEYLKSGTKDIKKAPKTPKNTKKKGETKKSNKSEKEENKDEKSEEIEKTVLEAIKSIEGEDGASWDSIMEKCKKTGLNQDAIEESLNSLMDKGLIYEPILGTIKTT